MYNLLAREKFKPSKTIGDVMTLASYAARLTKHFMQKMVRKTTVPVSCGTIDLTPRVPRLAWLGGKMYRQANGGRKNTSMHSPEHGLALLDNRNPYQGPDGKWYWYDETEQACEIGYETRAAALVALDDYVKWLNTPHEIGGVPEVGLPAGENL
jgi:hypothetical protein